MAPIFGLDGNVAVPPFSALLSLLLVAGVDAIGLLALRAFPLGSSCNPLWLRFQAPVVGAALLSAMVFPLALAEYFPRHVATGLAISIALGGGGSVLFQAPQRINSEKVLGKRARDTGWRTIALLATLYCLLALCPITEADALDYHVGVALDVLNFGAFPARPEWFHSRLAGSGEVLIALGLAIGAEQFSSLLQLCGLYAILAVFIFPWQRDNQSSKWLALALLSTPVFVAWVASPKPMLLPGAMTTSSLIIAYRVFNNVSPINALRNCQNAFLLICLLTMIASTMKLNFMLSGGVVGIYASFLLLRRTSWRPVMSIGAPMFFIIIVPFAYWKWLHFGGKFELIAAFPGDWPGTSDFEKMLRDYRDTKVVFPISLLIPSTFGTFSTVLGVGLIYLLPILGLFQTKMRGIIIVAIVVTVGGYIFGQRNSRFFLEPFYWILMTYRVEPGNKNSGWTIESIFPRTMIAVQYVIVTLAILVGLILLLPGALTADWREMTMLKRANGYSVMKWVDKVLPADAVLVTHIRSIALSPRSAIANDWREHVGKGSVEEHIYNNIIYNKQPNFILVTTQIGSAPPEVDCAPEAFAGPFNSNVATRNPFNVGVAYSAWLLKIDLPCLKDRIGSYAVNIR